MAFLVIKTDFSFCVNTFNFILLLPDIKLNLKWISTNSKIPENLTIEMLSFFNPYRVYLHFEFFSYLSFL